MRRRLRLGIAATSLALLALVAAVPARAATTAGAPLLGVYDGNQGWAMSDVTALESWLGRKVRVLELFTDWNPRSADNLFGQQLPAIWANGNVPLVTWEPFTGKTTPSDIEARIARGDYDAYARSWLSRLASTAAGRTVYVRFAHEANGNWYPWSPSVGGQGPSVYQAMWRRVRALAPAAGDIQWVWTANAEDVGGTTAEQLYPGDAYVDWVADDGYNWGASQSWSRWQAPSAVLGPMTARLRALAPGKPLAVTETASTSSTTAGASLADKSAWVRDVVSWSTANGAGMLVWFNEDKETDWAVFGGATGDESVKVGRARYLGLRAFREAVAGLG